MMFEEQQNIEGHKQLLRQVLEEADTFWEHLSEKPAGRYPTAFKQDDLPQAGVGAQQALRMFQAKYAQGMSGSSGSRYLGFVTGGVTPAALAGDWLTSLYDQNVIGSVDSSAPYIEREVIHWLRDLLGLSSDQEGVFVTGATMANYTGLAIARQWLGHEYGIHLSEEGLYDLPKVQVYSGCPHASIYKALSMLGLGKKAMTEIAVLNNREAMDVRMLEKQLEEMAGEPCIVVANFGTVNTGDFDDVNAILRLRDKYPFWLHIDAAFGGFAVCSRKHHSQLSGMAQADSLTVDAHKWLNVPYDAAMLFTRHRSLQKEVFQNSAAYLDDQPGHTDFVHLTPENSRRLRALPAWMTLQAYGREGYQEIVEQQCDCALQLADNIKADARFYLLANVSLNIVCFTIHQEGQTISMADIDNFLADIRQEGTTFLTPTVYKGVPAIRAAFSNWRTTSEDVQQVWNAISRSW